jgi:hypothetical protein
MCVDLISITPIPLSGMVSPKKKYAEVPVSWVFILLNIHIQINFIVS